MAVALIGPATGRCGGSRHYSLEEERVEGPVPSVGSGEGGHVVLVVDYHTPPPVTMVMNLSSGAFGVPPVAMKRKVITPPFMSAAKASNW